MPIDAAKVQWDATPAIDASAVKWDAKPTEIPGPRASTMNIITSAPYKAVAGAADVLLTAPENVLNLAKMGYGAAATAMGRPDLAPEVTPPRQPVAELFQRAGLIREPGGQTTPFQRVLDVGLQGATSAVLGGAPSIGNAATTLPGLVRAAGGLAATGGLSGAAGQTVTEATGEPLLGMATSMAVPAAVISAAQARQARLQAEQQRNAVRDLTVRQGQEEGFVTTPGSVTPNAQNVLVERIAGKSRVQQEAASRNQQVTDRLARRAVGIGENEPLTRANMQQIRTDEYAKGYAPINNIGTVPTDRTFDNALNNVLAAYTGPGQSFPGAIPQPVKELVNNYRVGQFTAADAVSATRTLREAARANMARGDNQLGLAQRAISNALEDQIERSLQQAGNPNAQAMLDQFRASRQRMAVSHAVEDAIVEGGGSVNARQLANDLQTRGKYFSGDLDLIARFANVARPVMTPPGTTGTPGAGSILGPTLSGGAGAGAASLMGLGPTGVSAGGALGVMAPTAISAAARNYLLSSMGQQRAFPTYSRPGVNALADVDPATLQLLFSLPTINNQNSLAKP